MTLRMACHQSCTYQGWFMDGYSQAAINAREKLIFAVAFKGGVLRQKSCGNQQRCHSGQCIAWCEEIVTDVECENSSGWSIWTCARTQKNDTIVVFRLNVSPHVAIYQERKKWEAENRISAGQHSGKKRQGFINKFRGIRKHYGRRRSITHRNEITYKWEVIESMIDPGSPVIIFEENKWIFEKKVVMGATTY